MQVTIDLPDDLVAQVGSERENLAALIQKALRYRVVENSLLAREVYEFLGRGPRPEEILSFRPSEGAASRASELLEKNREGRLTAEEQAEMEEMGDLNHFYSMVKAHARGYIKPRATE